MRLVWKALEMQKHDCQSIEISNGTQSDFHVFYKGKVDSEGIPHSKRGAIMVCHRLDPASYIFLVASNTVG